jgi:hypothetical protein
MSFFIGGRTKCSICHQVLNYRHEAALLPYIHPSVSASLAALGRTYAHRKCWIDWDSAKLFASAAYGLVKEGTPSDSSIKIELAQDNLILYWVPALKSYRLQDFSLLTIIDISLKDFPVFPDFLISAISQKDFESLFSGETYNWEIKQKGLNTEFTCSQDHEVIERFIVPNNRKALWLNALIFSKKVFQDLTASVI